MKVATFQKIKTITIIFLLLTTVGAFLIGNIFWGVVALLAGVIFLILMKLSTKGVVTDERVKLVSKKASHATFTVFTTMIALSSIAFVIIGQDHYGLLEALGIIFSYMTLFIVTLYGIFYLCFDRGWGDDEK